MNNSIAILIIALFLVSITTMYSIIDSLTEIESYVQMPTELISYADMSDISIESLQSNSEPQIYKTFKAKQTKGKQLPHHLFNGFINFYDNQLQQPFKSIQTCSEEGSNNNQAYAEDNESIFKTQIHDDEEDNSSDSKQMNAKLEKYVLNQNYARQKLRKSISNITKTFFLDEHIFGQEKNAFGVVSIRNDFMINPHSPHKHSSLDLFMIKDSILDNTEQLKNFQNQIEYSVNLNFTTKIITSFQSGENYIGVSLKGINYGQLADRQIGLIDLKKVEKDNTSDYYEEINVEPQSDISTLAFQKDVLVYANKEDYVLFRSRIKINNEWKNITSMHMIKNAQRLFSQTLSLNFLNISYDPECLNTLIVSYAIGQDESMLYKGDIFCLKKREQQYIQQEQNSKKCNEWEYYEPYIIHDLKSVREDQLYNWEIIFSAITKQMEFEVRKVDIFSLNLYKYFSFFYDRTKNIIVSSFLNKYIFITTLSTNQRSGDNHYFKIESFERDNTKIQKIMYSHFTEYVFILAQNYMQHSKVFMINIQDLDQKNSANVYRADFFYYDDELMVKDIELVEKKSEDNEFSIVKLVLENGDLAKYSVRSDEPIISDTEDSVDYPIYISIFVFGFIFFQQLFQSLFSRLMQANNQRRQAQQQQQQQQAQQPQQQQPQQQQNNQQQNNLNNNNNNNQNNNNNPINNNNNNSNNLNNQNANNPNPVQQQQQNHQGQQFHQIFLPANIQQILNSRIQQLIQQGQVQVGGVAAQQQQQQQQQPNAANNNNSNNQNANVGQQVNDQQQ